MQENTVIGHYRIIRPLGKGGMGEVYLAEDTRLKREVAIKVLPERLRSDLDRLKRFRREAEAAASLKHNNIATIYSLEEIDDQLLIVMEHVEGESLKDRIPDDGMDLDAFFATFLPLADALSHAHSQGRIHRDLKPGNIMIAEDGTPKILDFGLARIIDPDPVQVYSETETPPQIGPDDKTRTMDEEEQRKAAEAAKKAVPSLTRGGQLIGTPQYMSPEQAEREETDARTDLFSFGVVMYEALTGQRPFEGKTLESIIGRIVEAQPKAVTEIKPVTPYTLWTVIRTCLKKNRRAHADGKSAVCPVAGCTDGDTGRHRAGGREDVASTAGTGAVVGAGDRIVLAAAGGDSGGCGGVGGWGVRGVVHEAWITIMYSNEDILITTGSEYKSVERSGAVSRWDYGRLYRIKDRHTLVI